jgi:hypothetical protein
MEFALFQLAHGNAQHHRKFQRPHVSYVSPHSDGFPALPVSTPIKVTTGSTYGTIDRPVARHQEPETKYIPTRLECLSSQPQSFLQAVPIFVSSWREGSSPFRMQDHVLFVNKPFLLTEKEHTYIICILRVLQDEPMPSTTKVAVSQRKSSAGMSARRDV